MASNITGIGAKNSHIHDSTVIGVQYNTVDKVDVNKIQEQTREDINLYTQGTVEPSSLKTVLEMILTGYACVTITGSPGEGKSTLGYWILSKLQEESRNVYQVSSLEEFDEVVKTCAPVIMLDDIFGQTVFDHTVWEKWKKSLRRFFDMRDKQESPNKRGNLIVISRHFVLKSGSRKIEVPWEMLIQKGNINVVNINSRVRENEEKNKILNSIAEKHKVQLASDTRKTICGIKTPHGFPHACTLFITLYKEHSRTSADDFFNNPLEFLKTSLKILIDNEVIEHIFMEMIKGDGHVLKSELNKLRSEYIKTANDLCPTYLKSDRKGYVFDHPSILDTVAFLLCETKPSFILNHCSMDFIKQRVWLETPDGEKREETEAGAKLMVEIPLDEAEELATRFGKEIGAGNLWDVQHHNAWTSDMFVKLVIQSMSVDQLNARDRGWVGDELLRHLCEEERVDCVKVCGQRVDVNSQDGRGRTALQRSAITASTEIVSALLECGADVNFRGRSGFTALELATMYGQSETVSVLRAAGGRLYIEIP